MEQHLPKIFVAGHQGMVGSAIVRALLAAGHHLDSLVLRSRPELDLTNQSAVRDFFDREKPDQVYLAAAKVGGILANSTLPAEFIFDNLMIQANVVDAAFRCGTRRLLLLGSSCIYPRLAKQPMGEGALLTGALEPTNEPYAIAKIAGIKLCESYNRQYGLSHGVDYRSLMPTNLYGPGDNYHPDHAHVIPALLLRFHRAREQGLSQVSVWGSGNPLREFLYVDDLASACLHTMQLDGDTYRQHTQPMRGHINVGSGEEVSIRELAETIAGVVGYVGEVVFDATMPDGAPRKLMDSRVISELGWRPKVKLTDGLRSAYRDFLTKQQ